MAEHETTADVLAAMRDEGRTGESSCLEWVGAKMRHYADRLEAAHKRELARVDAVIDEAVHGYPPEDINDRRELGDAAKMREALIGLRDRISMFYKNEWIPYDEWEGADDDANAALSSPPRNCDRFGTDNMEASLAYEEFCDRAEVEESVNGAIAWLLTLVAEKEGGNK